MNAAAKVAPEPGITLVDVPEPSPAAGEVLIRIGFCGICGSDLPVYRWEGQPAKWASHLPRVMGHEFAGTVEALGSGVDGGAVAIGDKVAVEPGVTCGSCAGCRQGYGNLCERRSIVGIDTDGAFAQLVSMPATNVFRLDPEADLRRAAFLEVFALGLHCIERARLLPSHRVLVLGAGPVGLSVAALARLAGCEEVVVAGAPQDAALRLRIAAELGATDTVLSTDLMELEQFDVVVEASGAPAAVRAAIDACRIGGRVVAVGTSPSGVTLDWTDVVMRAIRIVPVRARLDRHWTDGARLLHRLQLPARFFEVFPLARVSDAFDAAVTGSAVKVLIEPGADRIGGGPASGGEAAA